MMAKTRQRLGSRSGVSTSGCLLRFQFPGFSSVPGTGQQGPGAYGGPRDAQTSRHEDNVTKQGKKPIGVQRAA